MGCRRRRHLGRGYMGSWRQLPAMVITRLLPPVTPANTGGNWGGGEAVIRFQPGPIFSGDPSDYWAPATGLFSIKSDSDLGGSGPLLVDVPGATPSHLVVALG